MKRALGPLDGRKKLTRCQPCARRRVKCQGGFPCQHCVRTGKACQPPAPAATDVEFVAVEAAPRRRRASPLPSQVSSQRGALYLDHFALFMQSHCQLTRPFAAVTADLMPLLPSCPALRDAVAAIGALQASRRGSVASLHGPRSPACVAYASYGRSIQALQARLERAVAAPCDQVLWTTFLLAIFDLLSDTSGAAWLQHMCCGTSKLFQLAGPVETPSALRQTLFDAFRVLETNRAVLYGDGTFLTEDSWQPARPSPAAAEPAAPDPTETTLALMIHVSSFSKRLFGCLEAIPAPMGSADPALDGLGLEGCLLQQRIRTLLPVLSALPCTTSSSQLSLINHYALELFLCRNFTFHPCWENRAIPSLDGTEVDAYVASILHFAQRMLKACTVSAVVLLFPLRMAGANALRPEHRDRLVHLLRLVHRAGFVISERIVMELQELWHAQATHDQELAWPTTSDMDPMLC